MTNAQLVLYPYLRTEKSDTWVFDDESKNLKAEAFVMGTSELITKVVETLGIPKFPGLKVTFDAFAFEGETLSLKWAMPLSTGNVYFTNDPLVGGFHSIWLCPALLKYFPVPPRELHVKVEAIPEGINPIWDVPKDRRAEFFFTDFSDYSLADTDELPKLSRKEKKRRRRSLWRYFAH